MRKRSQYGPQKGFFLLFILLVLLLLLWLIGKRDGWISGLSFNDKWVKRRNWLKPTRKRREHNTFLCLFFVFFYFYFFAIGRKQCVRWIYRRIDWRMSGRKRKNVQRKIESEDGDACVRETQFSLYWEMVEQRRQQQHSGSDGRNKL